MRTPVPQWVDGPYGLNSERVLPGRIEEYYPAPKAHLASEGTDTPAYVEQEFEFYLKDGASRTVSLRVRCDSCHSEHLVAFSCNDQRTPGTATLMTRVLDEVTRNT